MSIRQRKSKEIPSVEELIEFVGEKGVVLESASSAAPSLVEVFVGKRIGARWWSHRLGTTIFNMTRAVRESPQLLVCRLWHGKITFVHKRVWAALFVVRKDFSPVNLAYIREIHTEHGYHKKEVIDFEEWMRPRLCMVRLPKIKEARALVSSCLSELEG